MFLNIDPAASTSVGAQAQTVKRPEIDRVAETYQTTAVRDSVAFEETDIAARPAEKPVSGTAGARTETGKRSKTEVRDQAGINFQMTREEREVFLSAMSGRERVSEMSENEQKLMAKAAERLERLIEAADARDAASREKMDKAVKEWYIRLANGRQPPADLISLISDAAAGKLD